MRSALLAPWEPKAAEQSLSRNRTTGSEKLLKKLAAAQADHVEQEEQGGAYAVHCAVRGKADDCVELLLDALRDPAMVSPTPLPDDGDDAHRPRHYRDAPLGSALYMRPPSDRTAASAPRSDVSSKAQFKPSAIVTPLEVAVRRGDPACVALLLRAGATPSTADAYQGAKRGRGASSAHVLTKLLSDRVLVDLAAPIRCPPAGDACRRQARASGLFAPLLTWGASTRSRLRRGAKRRFA